MKKLSILQLIPLALFILVSQLTFAQTETLDIEIFQNNNKLKIVDNEVKLKREPFFIRVHLKEGVKGVYVQASFKDDLFRLRKRQPVPEFSSIPSAVMAEEPLNADRELIIRDDVSWHAWFFNNNPKEHFFDKNSILLNGNKMLGFKTIESFYFYDENEGGFNIPVYECLPDVYLFFLTASVDEDSWDLLGELNRIKLKLVWD